MASQHHNEYQGLQSHSVGSSYPWSVVGIGDDWQAQNLVTGEKRPRRRGYKEALGDFPNSEFYRELVSEARARKLQLLNERHRGSVRRMESKIKKALREYDCD